MGDQLDAVVWEHVARLLAEPTLIRSELDRRLAELQSTDPDAAYKSRLERELTRVNAARNRLIEAYQEELLSLDELRQQMPALRTKESTVRRQLDMIAARLADQASYVKLAESLESFLGRLQNAVQAASIPERQQVLRLVVKEVLVGPERIVIRHSLPVSATDPPPGYLLRSGRASASG
jgi:site-specific DNA recombinase